MEIPEFIKLLLVEDNPEDARQVREYLKGTPHKHFEMKWCHRLSEALGYLGQHTVDVILLDLFLPDSQGYQTFEILGSRVPNIPILLLTSVLDESLILKTIQGGAQDYLIKGAVNGDLLIRSIRDALARKQITAQVQHG